MTMESQCGGLCEPILADSGVERVEPKCVLALVCAVPDAPAGAQCLTKEENLSTKGIPTSLRWVAITDESTLSIRVNFPKLRTHQTHMCALLEALSDRSVLQTRSFGQPSSVTHET